MNEQDERFRPLGTHLIHVDGDTLFLVARGSVTMQDMQNLLNLTGNIKREHGCLFVLYDARRSTGIDADARKLIANHAAKVEQADLEVAFGISFALRVILTMVVRAQKVLQSRTVNLHLFEKESEGRAFFEVTREKIRQKLGANRNHFAASLQQRTPVE